MSRGPYDVTGITKPNQPKPKPPPKKLVATVGKGSSRKVTRKAIQDVNVPKACETIIEPGAPLALRLQGNLLYGTARVFAQQCGYVLADAEKTQSDMMTFFRVIETSETDPNAGKTKRQNIILPDDPNFDLFAIMPSLDLLINDAGNGISPSQVSTTRYSQLSPPNLSQLLLQPLRWPSAQPPSSGSAASRHHRPSNESVYEIAPYSKPTDSRDPMMDIDVLGDEQTAAIDFGLEIDEDGSWRVIDDSEAELPSLPGVLVSRPSTAAGLELATVTQDHGVPLVGGEDLIQEPPLPDAEAFPRQKHIVGSGSSTSESAESGRAAAGNKRANRRKAKVPIMLDEEDKVSRDEFRKWSNNYPEDMKAERKRQKTTTLAKAKLNAWAFISGNGVCDVGNSSIFGGIMHPLASHFAGEALQTLLQGRDPELERKEQRKGRRTSEEAFGQEEDREQGRKKPRTEEDAEAGRDMLPDDDDILMMGGDTPPEVGREPGSAMTDRHSSTLTKMPWSRPGSVIPLSSVRRPASAQKPAPASSPLARFAGISPLDRLSDPPHPASGDLANHPMSDDSSVEALLPDPHRDDFDRIATLDAESQKVLGYVTKKAMKENTIDTGKQRWVDFDRLVDPQRDNREIAATTFLHVLSLATKAVVAVKQDGVAQMVPFGSIRVGVPMKLIESAEGIEDTDTV